MLCISITGPTWAAVVHQVSQALSQGDILEFRFDLFNEWKIEDIKNLCRNIPLPVIFTLRGNMQPLKREETIRQLACLSPTYFDLEEDTSPRFAEELLKNFPKIKLIISYHNFNDTPSNLVDLLQKMHTIPASLYKLACKAHSINDSLRMLHVVRRYKSVLGICMGEKGKITRILGAVISPWTFSYPSPEQKTAPGQLSIKELKSLYALSHLNASCGIYGLIGYPITHSISHFLHNRGIQTLKANAVYIKMSLKPEELPTFFSLAKQVGIRGLSVTMPLKESILPFLDDIDADAKKIGAVNTIAFQGGRYIGYNTDGKGALDAIEQKLKVLNKKILILGAGGSARAIAYEAMVRGAEVSILNRSKEKASLLAKTLKIQGANGGLELINSLDYDVLINATPHPLPIPPTAIRPYTVVMDIYSLPKRRALLLQASRKKCLLVFGYEMLINQAVAQHALWFPSQSHAFNMHAIMQKEALKERIYQS